MKIAIPASGSRGDVQPYVALGQGLQQAGHQVRVLTSDDFRPLVEEAGLEFCSIGVNVQAVLESEEWRGAAEGGNFFKLAMRMSREMKNWASLFAERIPPLCEGADLIITGMSGMMGAFSIAQKLNIPLIQAYLFPLTPTSAYPSPMTPPLPVGGVLNRASFHVMRFMLWQIGRMADVATRKALDMPRPSPLGPFHSLKGTPLIYGYSRHVVPPPPDWSEHIAVTGYWFLDAAEGWHPPVALVDFLAAGPPPVYIGFGSMSSRNPKEAGEIALAALAQAGQRGIVSAGWGGLSATNIPDTVHLIGPTPHSWLFPQMAAVVHHGGAGTTAAGLRAGVPTTVVPFMGDQPFWGRRVAALGVGPEPLPRRQLTADRLAAAITRMVSDAAMRQRAADLGARLRAEDGIGRAVAAVEAYLMDL